MTERELLELAAKAAGYESDESWEYDDGWGLRVFVENGKSIWWNPLTDDGDALRLVVKLRLLVEVTRKLASAMPPGQSSYDFFEAREPVGTDPYAATRRAIVRAAAEIGEEMK